MDFHHQVGVLAIDDRHGIVGSLEIVQQSSIYRDAPGLSIPAAVRFKSGAIAIEGIPQALQK